MAQQLKNKLASGVGFVAGEAAGLVGENIISQIDWEDLVSKESDNTTEDQIIYTTDADIVDNPIDEIIIDEDPLEDMFPECNSSSLAMEDDAIFASDDYINNANVDDFMA